MNVVKVVTEIVLGVATSALSLNFWNCVKSPAYIAHVLQDKQALARIFEQMNWKSFDPAVDKIPDLGFEVLIGIWLSSAVKAVNKARNGLFIVLVVVLLISFFMGWPYFAINFGVVALFSFFDLAAPAKENVYRDVATVILNVRRWQALAPVACQSFCCQTQPKYLKCVYELVRERSAVGC